MSADANTVSETRSIVRLPPFAEFVAMVAVMMTLTALSIDIMLPVLPEIGAAMGVEAGNDRQLIVIVYVLAFALGQIVYGSLSDRFGRKPVLLAGFGIYLAGSVAAVFAQSFEFLLFARALQGVGAASPRVMSMAIVRDVYSGRTMARVMSLALSLFVIIPIFAPAIGQALAALGGWQIPFLFLLVFGAGATVWFVLRLPETRPARGDNADGGGTALQSVRVVLANRLTVSYAVASGFLFGSLLGFIASCQQIFADVYGLEDEFPWIFGGIASVMAVSFFVNARIVERLGMRFVSHCALVIFIACAVLALVLAGMDAMPAYAFGVTVSVCFFLFGLISPNFNALAMEPQGERAGVASSLVGFCSTGGGAVIAGLIGYSFDGTVIPLLAGYVVTGVFAALAAVSAEGFQGLFGRGRPGNPM